MIHYAIGNIGHLFVILSFVLSIFAAFAYFRASSTKDLHLSRGWLMNGRFLFYAHAIMVVGAIATLFLIIYNNYFEYHYAYSHSSKHLPVYYMIACFWEGQEGSFLLWTFWNCVLGIILINTNKFWEGPVMTIFAFVQAFLASMILGVVIFNVKIGSSPFLLLRDVVNDPIFQINPDFVPKDGSGLNPLLQNYWMVIHPPTLFLGYATTLVPFAYLISGLWKKKYSDWIRPAMPWAIFSTAVMGIGQLMGAYWAYETLSFGGYWNWDPVENAVYVPWIVQVASIHTMILYRKSKAALKTSIILVITVFILVLYATFLTRSGILGNASVHSFTDLGLSGQLLIYLFAFLILSLVLLVWRWKDIPASEKEISTYSREFWIFIGATVLCLMGFQIIVPTSIPVWNKIINFFGGTSNMALPADQTLYFSKFQIWGGILIGLLSGTGQFFWWKKMDKAKLWNVLAIPIIVSLAVSMAIFVSAKVQNISYILLLTAGVYAIVANGSIVLMQIRKKGVKLSGGSITHIGVALMLIGILFSAGYKKIISLNRSGLLYSRNMSDDMNRENVLLFLNEPREMNTYNLVYKGQRLEVVGVPGYVKKRTLERTADPYTVVARDDYVYSGKTYFRKGDSLQIRPENTYYEVEYQKSGEKAFTLYPRAQVNPNMGGLIVSPDIKRQLGKDLYTHISSIPDPDSEKEWSDTTMYNVKMGERFFVNDYVAELKGIQRLDKIENIPVGDGNVAVKAIIQVYGKSNNYTAEPIFVIQNRMMGNIPDVIDELGIKLSFLNVHPESNSFELSAQTTQKDYIIMKAIEMPLINVLWLGTFILAIGFIIAIRRRYIEFMHSKT